MVARKVKGRIVARNGSRKRKSTPTPLATFIIEELARLGWTLSDLEARSGIPDTTLGRLLKGQEASPTQLARIAMAFEKKFWYVMQRAGYTTEVPDTPGAEAQRLGALLNGDTELQSLLDTALRLSPRNRKAVLAVIRTMLEQEDDAPDPPKSQ